MATLAGWHSSKISKIEYGKQTPSEDDIRTWCHLCGINDQVNDFVIAVRDIEAMYVEWRRRLRSGMKARQEKSIFLEANAQYLRWYEPVLIPGLLHTPEYATAVMRRVLSFYEVPDDVDAAVTTRMQRQRVLRSSRHRFHFVIAQQSLRTLVGDPNVMISQLDRLLAVESMARVRFGVVPATAPYIVPTNQFIIFDERLVHVEAVSAEISITQPREIALYLRAFAQLAQTAVYGSDAKKMLITERDAWQRRSH